MPQLPALLACLGVGANLPALAGLGRIGLGPLLAASFRLH
jgi:hypothetical protein